MKYWSVVILLSASLFMGCTASKKAIREPLKEEGAEYLINKLKQNELKFSTISAKFTANFTRNKKTTQLSGQIRIHKDSVIWISITPMLGIEMARFLLTPDSIKYLNRINTSYLVKEFKFINQMLNKTLDFDMAQAFITGNDFSLYETNTFKAAIENREYKLSTSNRLKLKRFVRRSEEEISIPLQSIWLEPESFKITRVMLKEAERDSRKFVAEYNSFEQVDGQRIPVQMEYKIETDEEKIQMKIEFSKVLIDQDISFPFSVPENYSGIEKIEFK
jgi:N-acetyl-beta-hexosaminidase